MAGGALLPVFFWRKTYGGNEADPDAYAEGKDNKAVSKGQN